jgi:arabinose-5-phosphate isomerase
LEHEGDKWNIVPNNSTTLNLIVLQALGVKLVDKLGITLDTFKKNHPGGCIGEVLKNGTTQ